MIIEQIQSKGLVTIERIDSLGNVVEVKKENIIVSSGLQYLASRMKENVLNPVSFMGLGTGTTAAVIGNTSLENEIARVALDSVSIVTTTIINDSVQMIATFGPGVATGPITEAGLFNAVSGPLLIARTVFGVNTKTANDTIRITWKTVFI